MLSIEKPTRLRLTLGSMSFNEVIAELPRLTFEERQILIRRVVELDDPPLSASDEAFVEERLAAHHADPASSMSLDELKNRLRSR
ncbi:MAG TPA: hypothetical protein VFX97_19860 [Pyrinomonadaceae bacterium]|nr:hypothetical protein [Pyrinomonadaceae bacterium]